MVALQPVPLVGYTQTCLLEMPMPRALLSCILCAGLTTILASCATSPDLPMASQQATGPAPRLVPITGLVRQAAVQDGLTAATLASAPQARAANLRARAAALRGPIFDPSDRNRLTMSR